MEIYTRFTEEASKDRPSLIVWPETATPGSITTNYRLGSQVFQTARQAGVPILLGSSQHQKVMAASAGPPKYRNSAFLISPPTGRYVPLQRYDKIRLFPFGEYLPLKEWIPWHRLGVSDIKGYEPGRHYKIFETASFRFATTICWENLFPEMVSRFVMNGAQFIVNITNEAWFGKTAAPYQFLSISVMRAVENRVFVVRCANTGISCFIDPRGRIVDRVKDGNGGDVFVSGFLTRSIVLMDSKTIYTRYGDWFVLLCFLSSVAILILAWRREIWHEMSKESRDAA